MGLILCFLIQKLTNQSHSYIFEIAAILREICIEVTWQYYFIYVTVKHCYYLLLSLSA